jgi:hypothetical protein
MKKRPKIVENWISSLIITLTKNSDRKGDRKTKLLTMLSFG